MFPAARSCTLQSLWVPKGQQFSSISCDISSSKLFNHNFDKTAPYRFLILERGEISALVPFFGPFPWSKHTPSGKGFECQNTEAGLHTADTPHHNSKVHFVLLRFRADWISNKMFVNKIALCPFFILVEQSFFQTNFQGSSVQLLGCKKAVKLPL